MADEIDGAAPAPTDSAPPADAAPDHGPTADATDATHLEAGTPDATTAEPSDEDDSGDEDDAEGQDDPSQTDEQKRLSRSERRKANEQKRIAEAVQAELARERETAAETGRVAKAQADFEAAQQKWRQEFGSLVGTPEQRAALAKEIDDLIATTISVNLDVATQDEYDRLTGAQKALAEKKTILSTLDRNAETYRKLDEFQFQNTQAAFAAKAASLPESHRASYLSARTVGQALERLETGIRAAEQARAKAEVARVETEWKGKLAKEEAAHAATRTGAPGAGPSPNGANGGGSGGGTLTSERYRNLSFEERQTLKATPQGRAQIDAMMARQLAAR